MNTKTNTDISSSAGTHRIYSPIFTHSQIHILIYLHIDRFTVPTILLPRTKTLESLRFHLLVDPLLTSLHVPIFLSDVFATPILPSPIL